MTLIELAIVLIIMGTIASILLPTLTSTVKRGKMSEARAVLYAVRDEIIGYAVNHNNTLPDNATQIGSPNDPWGREVSYRRASALEGKDLCDVQALDGMMIVSSGNETLSATAFVLSSDGPDHVQNVANMSGSGIVNASVYGDDLFLHVGLYRLQAALCPPMSQNFTTPDSEPLTSLGSTFAEISSAMIGLIQQFDDENGGYPRSWGDYKYTDIGLDPEEWNQGYEGIIYTPVGNRVQITPEDGYTFYVTDLNGEEQSLPASYNWSLVYSMENATWYYHSMDVGNEIDISTLRVVQE